MVKSGKKYTYGVDEPGKLSIKTYQKTGYLLLARRGNTVYVFEGILNNKPRWEKSNQHFDYDFYGHPLDKLCKFFKKINNLENISTVLRRFLSVCSDILNISW